MQGYLILQGEASPLAFPPHPLEVDSRAVAARDGDRLWVHFGGSTYELLWRDAVDHLASAAADGSGEDIARAPMPGAVVSVSAVAGRPVAKGDPLLVIESMKLETTVGAPRDGIVEQVHVALGDIFERDAPLVTLVKA